MKYLLAATLALTSPSVADEDLPIIEEMTMSVNTYEDFLYAQREFSDYITDELIAGKDNAVLSPHSLYSCLLMLRTGAAGETHEAFSNLLGLNHSNEEVIRYSPRLMDHLAGAVTVANAIFIHPMLNTRGEFLANVANGFYAHQAPIDPILLEQPINTWVKEKTDGLIPMLFEPGIIGEDTRMVAVNALTVKGQWISPFEEANTHEEIFWSKTNELQKCQMMHQTTHFQYAEDEEMQVLSMPLIQKNESDARLSLLIFLPKEAEEVFEPSISQLPKFQQRLVNVSLPKFNVAYSWDLDDTLKDLGLDIAYSDAADFSAICEKGNLALDKVIHKVSFEVTEGGLNAAAATGAAINLKCSQQNDLETPVHFKADHPFMYALVETETQTPLFIGTFNTSHKE